MAQRAKEEATTKNILVTFQGGNIKKITVPTSWHMTFGPTVPFEKGAGTGSERGLALRFYEDAGKANLKAVFRDVKEFMEEGTITVLERVVRRKTKVLQNEGSKGGRQYTAEMRETVWKDPMSEEVEGDDETDFLALPKVEEQF